MDVFSWKRDFCSTEHTKLGNRKATLVVTCGHDLWLPPGERQSFPGKLTGSISQTEHSAWFPEVTVPTAEDAGLPPGFMPLFVSGQEWRPVPGRGFQDPLQNCTHLAMFTGQGGGVGMMITRPLRKIFSEVVFELNREGKREGSNAHVL